MSSSILLTYFTAEAVAAGIERHYGFKNVRCRLLTNSLRDVYLVESDGGVAVFYLYRQGWRTLEQIQNEWELVEHLATLPTPVRVPRPIAPHHEGMGWMIAFQAPEGERYGVLAQYVEGVSLRVRISEAIVYEYGQALGSAHAAWSDTAFPLIATSHSLRPSNDGIVLLENAHAYLAAALDRRPAMLQEITEAIEILLPRLQTLTPTVTNYGLVHGDVARHNALVDEEGTLTLLDFDYCGVGWRAYDIATMFFSLHYAGEQKDVYRAAFVEGYRQRHPLPPKEAATLPLFEAVRVVFDAGLMANLAPVWGYQHCWNEVQGSLVQLKRVMGAL